LAAAQCQRATHAARAAASCCTADDAGACGSATAIARPSLEKSSATEAPTAGPPTRLPVKQLEARFHDLFLEGEKASMTNTRVGYLAAVAKARVTPSGEG